MINASKIVADTIAAKRINVGDLIVARPIQLKGGDIAYQFTLKNPDDHPNFAEGEVVGLFVDENGQRVLDKLSQENTLDALLKGVITRSQYIVANVQPEGGKSVCSLIDFITSIFNEYAWRRATTGPRVTHDVH